MIIKGSAFVDQSKKNIGKLFVPIKKFVWNIIIFSFLLLSVGNSTEGTIQLDLCDIKSGKTLQTQKGYDPIYWHGFDIAHAKGMKGEGNTIAFIEGGVINTHVQFQEGQVTIVDCSQNEEIVGEDRALFRIGPESIISKKRLFFHVDKSLDDNNHGTHVMGVALGQPMDVDLVSKCLPMLRDEIFPSPKDEYENLNSPAKFKGKHGGGCCPGAQGYLYTFSAYKITSPDQFHFKTTIYEMGTALLSFQQFIDLKLYTEANAPSVMKRFEKLTPPLSDQEVDFFKTKPVDGSLMVAFREALKGPGYVVSCSFKPFTIMDPTKKGAVPIHILDELAMLAEENDKIFVWAAGNDTLYLDSEDYDYPNIHTFFQQVCVHPILSKRTIIAVNAYPTTEDDSGKLADIVLRGKSIPLKLHPSSNYPGDKLKELCLSAVGSSILSGYNEDTYKRMTGTSQAAPIIASIATLVYSKAKKEGQPINGLKVIEHLKKTALPLPDPKFGCGYVWAPTALGIEEGAVDVLETSIINKG